MFKYILLLVFLLGIHLSRGNHRDEMASVEARISGIKKNEVGANGFKMSDKTITNFRNPVHERLLESANSMRTAGSWKNGIPKGIQSTQTIMIPRFIDGLYPVLKTFLDPVNGFNKSKQLYEEAAEGRENSHTLGSRSNLRSKPEDGKSRERIITSPVLHLNKYNRENNQEYMGIQVYPATAVLINTFRGDGTLKSSVTHYQPDFNLFNRPEAVEVLGTNKYFYDTQNPESRGNNYVSVPNISPFTRSQPNILPQRAFRNWLLSLLNKPSDEYGTRSGSLFNSHGHEYETNENEGVLKVFTSEIESDGDKQSNAKYIEVEREKNKPTEKKTMKLVDSKKEKLEDGNKYSNLFDEITLQSDIIKTYEKSKNEPRNDRKVSGDGLLRSPRDTTSVHLKTRQGNKIDITIEEPKSMLEAQKNSKESNFLLRKGGITIVGPGGAATAYTGGTAIVGPYGTVYKSPEGVAILGPFARVVDITDDMSFEDIIKMHSEMQNKTQNHQVHNKNTRAPAFKNYKNAFSYITNRPVKIESEARANNRGGPNVLRLKEGDVKKVIENVKNTEYRRLAEDLPFNKKLINKNETTLIFRPKSKAEAGKLGIAVSVPSSHAILYPGQKASIFFEPESVASAGPSGFAHAHSDLLISYMMNSTSEHSSEPGKTDIFNLNDHLARSFSSSALNTPPFSSIVKPPVTGYIDKKRKSKPDKNKEEGSSEESEEEKEEETTTETPESANEGANESVSISRPPEGASVAEAKPIGLAIAGPGGVAASKPQGTAVVGPGGLAIARPVGTAIAGVQVEGSVPIGGQKHKKKPKKEPKDPAEGELHYVGGLTGPIGNPQPKEFPDALKFRTAKEGETRKAEDQFFFRGRPNGDSFQLKLGKKDDKYGFIPVSPTSGEGLRERSQKRVDPVPYYHTLLGTNENNQYRSFYQ